MTVGEFLGFLSFLRKRESIALLLSTDYTDEEPNTPFPKGEMGPRITRTKQSKTS